MSDKWKNPFEEDDAEGLSWENPFETERADLGGDESWREVFDAAVSDVPGLDLPAEDPDTFPVDEALFGPEGAYYDAVANEEVFFAPVGDDASAEPGDEGAYDYDDDYDDEHYEKPERAVRLARRKRTGFLGGVMYAAFILGVSTILAFVGWMLADDVLGLTRDDTPIEIAIPENFTIEEVADILYDAGVINHRWLFMWYAEQFERVERIQPGVYQVRPADFRAITGSLNQRTGAMVEVRVMIPEGRTMVQTFEILEAHGVATVDALMYAAENGTFHFDFLEDVPLDADYRLQGFLFPDTYIFFLHQNPEAVIRSMLRNFDTRMRQNDIYELLEDSEFTLHEIVNIAAMIEREMANAAEAPRISSVIHNRLNLPMRLQIDATIQFILPEVEEFVTYAHTQIPSVWNTYYVDGLPYGPIANPGVATILAALQPENTNFLFYALHINGHHEFFRNFDQHSAFMNTPNFAHHADNR
ncbi:MAG: endolytic transglycosylase MltG [Oscillospiraceae bacterium]|nr:endolytic transglycosylase MltG [Oscillospiraceae bacterium]